MFTLLFCFVIPNIKDSPRIDGIIEESWYKVEPFKDFTQSEPEEGKPATESTFVYVLQDEENLYVAFKCFSLNAEPVIEVRGWDNTSGDNVVLYIDTYGDCEKGYYFTVSASGTQGDGLIVRGGVGEDYTWNGIWFAKSRITDYGYNVEMKIPFKTIRYNKGEWGIQFEREIPSINETDYFVPVKRFEGLRISNFKKIYVSPEAKGRYLELYPVGMIKYSDGVKPNAGIDLSYNPTSSFGMNLTFNPDYAEIEADPFRVNLSRYAKYLSERRPFFIEGQELFKVHTSSNFNIGDSPIRIFYTRNIGKVIDDSMIVPIYFGIKEIIRLNKIENAIMYVLTGKAGSEPLSHYLGLRLRGSFSPYFTGGFTFIGKENRKTPTNVFSFDLSYLKGENDFLLQGSYGDSAGKGGPAMYFNYSKINNRFMIGASGRYISTNYAINEIGYQPYKGYSLNLALGPIFTPNKGIKYWGFAGGIGLGKEDYVDNLSKGMFLFSFVNFKRSNMSGSISMSDAWEDTSGIEFNLIRKGFNLSFHHKFNNKIHFGVWGNLNYGFNWESYYTCYYATYGGYLEYEPIPNAELFFESDFVIWWDEGTGLKDLRLKNLKGNYITFCPSLSYFFNTKVKFNIRTEIVYEKNQGWIQKRINPVLSYNISPKSWVYLVYTVTYEENMVKTDEGATFKIRYLFYF